MLHRSPLEHKAVVSSQGYFKEDTIVAPATPMGGAIAVLRLSGPKVVEFLSLVCPNAEKIQKRPRYLHRSDLRDGHGKQIDDALVVYFSSPNSYTGEDLAEFHIHGSSLVLRMFLEQAAKMGIRLALPGEFSFRAVRNGKMNLSQAEAVADLIHSENSRALELALEKLSGSQGRLVYRLANELRRLASLAELEIDFSDQGLDELSLDRLKVDLRKTMDGLRQLRNSFERGKRVQEGVSVCLLGVPNSGKSSFFNQLTGEDVSIVSEMAGTTRDVVKETITLEGRGGSVTFRVHDTAGLRKSRNEVEKEGIRRSLKVASESDLVLFLADLTQPVGKQVSVLEELLESSKGKDSHEKVLGILSKKDLVRTSDLDSWKGDPRLHLGLDWHSFSAVGGEGLEEIIESMTDRCGRWVFRAEKEVLLTHEKHFHAVSQALLALERGEGVSEAELFSADLRQALNHLSPLIGETLPDDLLATIFSEFCIGK